jgi:hypothetical protein
VNRNPKKAVKPAALLALLLLFDAGITLRVLGRTPAPSFWPPPAALDQYTPIVLVDTYENASSQVVCEAAVQVGYTYRLQKKADLSDTNGWEDILPGKFGSTNWLTFTDPDPVRTGRFYRVVR